MVFSKVQQIGEKREHKRLGHWVGLVNSFEPEMEDLSDDELPAKSDEFRRRLEEGETLDDLLPEAFAAVREAARRTIGQRHYDVQVMGASVLHQGKIAEMKTGEGKTLVSTMPIYLNALAGEGVHVVTVNDYLAKRDSEWMGPIYRALGISVGLIQSQMRPEDRRPNYAADVTYGTNNEFGFDYLRDNMAMRRAEMVQRGHHYAIIDEVDSILIDEARTPLIISGPVQDSAKWYTTFARIAPRLKRDHDYEVDESKRTVSIAEEGVARVEDYLGIENLYEHANTPLVHHLQNALRAKELYKRDVDYIVTDGEVLIVDEFTGRVLHGRRYSEGLHQAIEAKEGVRIKEENQTLATITIQNYFRMYEKLGGMTGTAKTQAAEFEQVYKLPVVTIPTNQEMIRLDENDLIYKTADAKWNSLIEDIVERHEKGQPVLVGTVSIEKSEHVSKLLQRRGVTHNVLNAKQHEREATIIAQAGQKGSVTVATNMAGRGVDIMLGGNPEYLARQDMAANDWDNDRYLLFDMDPEERKAYEDEYRPLFERHKRATDSEHDVVKEVGGLYVLGTERHESRRIDNQLRGRSGRQGDPGESRFYLSLEDDLMRLFASDRITSIMNRLKWPEDEPITARMVTRAIESAQRQVEGVNFERRKNVLKYDEVMNTQRKIVYADRRRILEGESLRDRAIDMVGEVIQGMVAEYVSPEVFPEDWDLEGLLTQIHLTYTSDLTIADLKPIEDAFELSEKVLAEALEAYEKREAEVGEETMRELERMVFMSIIDNLWREHLQEMDYLQEGIGLRAYGQRDPLVEYQNEGHAMFEAMKASMMEEFVRYIYRVEVVRQDEPSRPRPQRMVAEHGDRQEAASPGGGASGKVPRNAPCPCGSGKKYKKCHGAA
ncbi:MAG TPA: preprotein translocase subunit SecA [Actinomycetota bacterium]|nr:preprotein translocase subunit SecA [Actinomycetota bacterium]